MSSVESAAPATTAPLPEPLPASAADLSSQDPASQVAASVPLLTNADPAQALIPNTNGDVVPVIANGVSDASAITSVEDVDIKANGILSGHPDEAAWVAAAAAMAAAQGHHSLSTDSSATGKAEPSLTSTDLNSYFLAAAASIQQQQQQQQQQQEHQHQQQRAPQTNGINQSDTGAALVGAEAQAVNDDYEQQQARVHAACQVWTVDRSPFPLGLGKRQAGGMAEFVQDAQAQGADDPAALEAKVAQLPISNVDIGLGKTRCCE